MIPNEIRRRIRSVTVVCMSFGWGLAWATVQATYPDIISLPWAQIAVGAAIAAWGGATATMGRYLTAVYESKPFFWRPEVLRDLAVSIAVGSGGYLAGWSYDVPPPMMGLMLLLFGYGGTRVLSAVVERMLSSLAQKNDKE